MNRATIAVAALALCACSHARPAPRASTPAPAAAAAPAAPAAAKILSERPPMPALKPFAAPAPHLEVLANGLTLIVIERADAPLETLGFTTKHGAVHDGKLPGLASLTGELLQAGSAGKSASQIAAEITALGTELHLGASREDLTGSITVLPAKFSEAASLLGEVVLQPNLDAKEFERVKKDRKAKLVALLDEPRAVASDVMAHELFGDTGYGEPVLGTQKSIDTIKLANVKKYLSAIDGANSAVFAAGPLSVADVKALVQRSFGAMKKGQPEAKTVARPMSKRPAIALVDKPGAPQSVLRLAEPSVVARSPDRYALELANMVFGGSFTSRINQNLREKHGYTYGAHSDFDMMRGGGYFLAATDVKTDVTAAAVEELHNELRAMAQPGLSQADLDKSKALFIEGLVEDLQTTPGTARAIADLWTDELPLDEYSRVVPLITKLDVDAVNAAWKRTVDLAQLTLVIVGDAKSVEPQLEKAQLPKPIIVSAPK